MDPDSKLVQHLNEKIKFLEKENAQVRGFLGMLNQSEEGGTSAFENFHGMCIVDENLEINFINKALLNLVSFELSQLFEKPLNNIISAESHQPIKQHLTQKNFKESIEVQLLHVSGKPIPAILKASPISKKGSTKGFVFEVGLLENALEDVFWNIKKDAFKDLWKFIYKMPMSCIIIDGRLNVKFINAAAESTFSVKFEDIKDRPLFETIVPADTKGFFEELLHQAKTNEKTQPQAQYILKVHQNLVSEWHLFPYVNHFGDACNILICSDVTERYHNERLLEIQKSVLELMVMGKEHKEVLSSLLKKMEKESEGALCSLLLIDEKGERLKWEAAPSLPEEYMSQLSDIKVGPDCGSCGAAVYHKEMVTVTDIENDLLWEESKSIALKYGLKSCSSAPIFGKNNEVLGSFAFYYKEKKAPSDYDIKLIKTSSAIASLLIQSRNYVNALKESEELFHLIMENINDVISLHSDMGKISFVNKAIEQALGFKPEEFLKYDIAKDAHPDDVDIILHSIASLKNNQPSEVTFRVKHKDGSWRWLETWNKKVKRKGENVIVQVARDISEKMKGEEIQSQLTEELIRQNKELQQFSYITSHNLRAPLANIMGLISIFNYQDPSDEMNLEILKNLETSVVNIDNIIKDLNQIVSSRNRNENKKEIFFEELMEVVKTSLQKQIDNAEAVILTDFEKAPSIYSVMSYMQSIFTNLIENAIKYRSPTRNLFIEVTSFTSDDSLIIKISDNGLGIDLKKYGSKIFGLYKRFHKHVGGKGLGLHLVKTQVEAIGGTIKIESELDKGTSYTLTFKHNE